MRKNRWSKIEKIFNAAVVLPADKKTAFVTVSCGDNKHLRDEILELLREDDRHDGILEKPIFSLGARLLDGDFDEILQHSEFASYYLHKKLGRGGMGAVFLAEDSRLERLVALKILPSRLADNTDGVSRFQQEARAASAISHPNVAHIYEFGKFENHYFLAMEYIPGKTLREMMKEKRIGLARAADIVLQIAKALAAAHKAGIVHRDIKPENIMILEEGGECSVKVLDFGLAKFAEPSELENNLFIKLRSGDKTSLETAPGMIIGTTAYMSPEQVRAQNVTGQTDIWSLGVVLFELLAQKRPFVGDTRSDVQAAILLAEPPSPPFVKEFPELEKIVKRALTKDAGERYKDATDLVHDLQSVRDRIKVQPSEKAGNSPIFNSTAENGETNRRRYPGLKRFFQRLRIHEILRLLLVIVFAGVI